MSEGRISAKHVALVLFLLIVVVFGQTVFFEFVDWDDNINVYENPYLLSLSVDGLKRLWSAPYASLYVPLVYTTYFVELLFSNLLLGVLRPLFASGNETKVFFQIASGVIHFDNVLLHWVATLSVFRILRRMLGVTNSVALAAASVFAIHPLQVEPVVWATGRKDLLCWTLVFLSVDQFSLALQKSPTDWKHLLFATLFYILAMFSKPTAVVTAPLGLVVLWYCGTTDRRAWQILGLWFLLAAAAYYVHQKPQSDLTDAPFLIAWWKRPFLAADNLLFYFQKVLLPIGLIPIYPRRISDVFSTQLVWFALPIVSVLGLATARSRRFILAAAFIFFPVAPVLGFVSFIYQFFSVVGDRYFYGSMAGVTMVVALSIEGFLRIAPHLPKMFLRVASLFAALWLFTVGASAFAQARHWKSSESLWRHELAYFPTCVHALYNLASRLADQGQLAEAISMYERILVVDPYYAAAYTNLILLNDKLGRRDQVQMYAAAALELPPNCAENFLARGHGLLALGKAREAVESFRAAIHGLPEDAPAHNSLGMAYLALGDLAHAKEAFQRAIELNPRLIPARMNLGNLLLKVGDRKAAQVEYEAILQIAPSYIEAKRKLQQLKHDDTP
ncbi:MAG: tetratricopeptide repeat protein [Candidatus Sumerlaeaceae bacterium]